ncbi:MULTISPECIES: molybdopterin-dependent oxidoreductase [Paraburkholderia]|uniref:Molybdopterin-dependent oxidoreductase n=1 Tax=Paraburkholderia youngii TaxID=2782701 RepID=A0A7W8P8L7_9BURK|nr:molybdopterin-dependent oxidoreductase [Paraburkholderia youngii]MBB5404207.1 hypothetical protein [Paraburkholderia youngii]NVI09522.1 molybdopterin-dependent oxidoreductase [Paraburkholderia youngii]
MANLIATLRNAAGETGVPSRMRWLAGLAGLIFGLTVYGAHAQPDVRQSPALALDVEGKIANTNDAAHRTYHFDEAQLLALPVHTITTSTTWTPRSTFAGPRLADILKAVGARGSEIELHTYDDYTYTVPVADCERYGVIVAYSMNGQRLKLSDFGPLFLIYPRDAFPDELTGAVGDSKFVWQIKALIVK